MVTQIDQLIAATASTVLFAALSKLNGEPERQRAATLRAGRLMTVLSSIASFGLMVTVPSLEKILWGGKWEVAVLPAQIVCVAFAWRVLLWVPSAALQAQGRFRQSAVLMLLAGLGLSAAGVVSAKLGQDGHSNVALPISIGVLIYAALGFLAFALWGMRTVGVRPWEVLRQTAPTWACVGAAGGVGLVVHHYTALFTAGLGVNPRVTALADFIITGSVFVLVAGVLLRVLLPGIVKEAAGLLPARLAFLRKLA
jgi:O-antigen/teichoic acid export membrane protein